MGGDVGKRGRKNLETEWEGKYGREEVAESIRGRESNKR